MSINSDKIKSLRREIVRLEKSNSKFKKKIPLSLVIGLIMSIVYPYMPRRMVTSEPLIEKMSYFNGVIYFLVIFLIILFGSYFFITNRNKKTIDKYYKQIRQLED